jgi:hypothetical protein
MSWRLGLAAFLLIVSSAAAQRLPHIGYVYPAGGRQGTTFDVRVAGQNLGAVAGAFVSGEGIRAEVVSYNRPLNQRKFNELRDKVRKLQQKQNAFRRSRRARRGQRQAPPLTAEEQKTVEEFRMRLAERNRRRAVPALADTAVLRIHIAEDARLGLRELRLRTRGSLTNPLVFCVGELPEFKESESRTPRRRRDQQQQDVHLKLPAVANGQIMPGDVDRFRFHALKGQRLVVAVSARQLIPYLADAVPGWFQATLALLDEKGKELAFVDDYRFDPDPVLSFEVPADGNYAIEIRDAIYRGREDFVYRITIGELPFVTSVFPLGGPANQEVPVYVRGWNLPARKVTVSPQDGSVVVRDRNLTSNIVPFARGTLPECRDQEPNDSPQRAQQVTLPQVVNGRIDRPSDRDVFRFRGLAGQTVVAEVLGRRLRSPIDSVLRLTDATGRQLGFNDDHKDKGAGLTTHHADSWLSAKLPRTGTYYLHLWDAQGAGGEDHGYRLRLSTPRPDFDLRVVPSSINARAGQTIPITVHAIRRDGFKGGIDLALQDAPPGFRLSGPWLPAQQDKVRLTLTVPGRGSGRPIPLRLVGRARVQGRDVVRRVVAAEDMMQAFLWRHLVPSQELLVSVTGRGFSLPLQILEENPVLIPAGCMTQVRVGVTGWGRRGRGRARGTGTPVQIELSDPPPGVSIHEVSRSRNELLITVLADAAKSQAGTQGNLIFQVFAVPQARPRSGNAPPRRPARRRLLGLLPAVPFEIVTQ